MNALVRAELLKLRSTSMLAWLLVATEALVVVTAAVETPTSGANVAVPLHDPTLLASVVGTSFGVPQVTMVLLGVLVFTQELRYGTVTSTFLVEPRRSRVLVAKCGALTLAAVLVTAVTLVISIALTVALISGRDGNVTVGVHFGQVVAALFLDQVLYGVIGLALGALLRNQIVAVVAVLVWMNAGEHLLLEAFPSVARWTPGGATYGLLQLGRAATTRVTLLDAPIGALVLIGYTAVAVALALIVVPRRDIL